MFVAGTKQMEEFCPFEKVDIITRETLAGYGFLVIMVATVLLTLFLNKFIYNSLDTIFGRYYAGYYAVLAFCYKSISRLAFKLIHCVTVEGNTFLYINGE